MEGVKIRQDLLSAPIFLLYKAVQRNIGRVRA